MTTQKKMYQPDNESDRNTPFIIDYEMRKTDCTFMNMYNSTKTTNKRGQQSYGVVQLDFEDFYTLMKLKIQF